MMVREKGVRRGGSKGNLFGQVLEEVEGLSPLQLDWRAGDRRFTALGELIASDDIERHHWSGAGLAVVFDKASPFVRAMVKQGSSMQLQPTVLSLIAIPAGRHVAYFGHNRRATILARRHHFGVYAGRIRLAGLVNKTDGESCNPNDEPYWDLSKPPTSIPRNAVMVKERAAYVSAPFSGNFMTELRDDLSKYLVMIKDRHTGVSCVVAEIPLELVDQGLLAPEIHDNGAPVSVGDKLVAFVGVQTFLRLRDATSRIPLENYLARRPVLPRDVLNPEKFGAELKIYTAMMNQLTNGVIERLRLVDQLPKKSDNLSDHRFRLWREDYQPSPNAHPEDWLPEAYVFHERGVDQSDASYFGALRLKMNLSFKEELERQVHGYFGIPAPMDGKIVAVDQLPPDRFGKQGYDVRFIGADGWHRSYRLPWTAGENGDFEDGKSNPFRLNTTPRTVKAGEIMAFACKYSDMRISLRKVSDLLDLCGQNAEMAKELFDSYSFLLVQCRCEPVPSSIVSGGKPGMMMSARYLEKTELPSPYYMWWDLRPLLPFYRDDLGCALLPRLQWDTIGHTWRGMVIHCNDCRLDFQPHIESRFDKEFNGFPFSLIEAGHMRPKSGAAAFAASRAG